MCNHYRTDRADLDATEYWAAYNRGDFDPSLSDVYPASANKTETVYPGAVLVNDEAGRSLRDMAWGIVTTIKGAKGQPLRKAVTNVRNLSSPFWRNVIGNPAQRCLVPFSSFAEPKIGAGREEHWFNVVGRPIAAFAGVWRMSEGIPRFAFLTCEPNPLVAPLHPKAMPVILHEADYEQWMTGSYDDAVSLAQPYPSQLMAVA